LSKIKFGIVIPQGWRNDLSGNSSVAQFKYSRDIAIGAEKNGFDSAYAYDHFIPHYRYPKTGNFFECFTLLSALSTDIKRMKIGQIVTCNSYRNPALLAKMVATLDVITNGRAELGIGAGWFEEEYIAYGYQYSSDVTRIIQLEESIQIIKKLWTQKNTNFQGRHYSVKDAVSYPKPIQKPHPTIMVGGSGEKYLLKVAAKYADRYNLYFGSPEEMKRKISILNGYNSQNRNIENSIVLPCLIVQEHEQLKKVIKKMGKQTMTVAKFKKSIAGGLTVGTIDEVMEGISQYVNIGVNHFIFHFLHIDIGVLRKFSKVIKKFKTSD
jgi:alkanesulfonate monooxygenase SsuD/methylene tetrahydromethanopterin reductase-like flavin-dependent oxidoreductase (luciferase family)